PGAERGRARADARVHRPSVALRGAEAAGRGRMRTLLFCAIGIAVAFGLGRLSAQAVAPSCMMCPSTYIPASEVAAYERIGRATGITDQQMRSVDIGKAQVQIALVHRGKLDAPAPRSAAEHHLVSEVYYVLSGSGTNLTGPELVGAVERPSDDR